MSSQILTDIVAAQSTDMQYLSLFSDISNRESLSQAAAFGSGMHKSNTYFEAIQLWKRPSSLFDWQQLLVHKCIQLILYFSSAVNLSISIACVTNALSGIARSVGEFIA